MNRCQHFREHDGRISDSTSKHTGMQIMVRAGHFNLQISQTLSTPVVIDGTSCAISEVSETRIMSDRSISLWLSQNAPRLGEPISSSLFDQKFHIASELRGFYQVFECFDVHKQLPFIVVGTPAKRSSHRLCADQMDLNSRDQWDQQASHPCGRKPGRRPGGISYFFQRRLPDFLPFRIPLHGRHRQSSNDFLRYQQPV